MYACWYNTGPQYKTHRIRYLPVAAGLATLAHHRVLDHVYGYMAELIYEILPGITIVHEVHTVLPKSIAKMAWVQQLQYGYTVVFTHTTMIAVLAG